MDQARVATLALNLRATPGGAVVGVLHQDMMVTITGAAQGNWLPISVAVNGTRVSGYVAEAYLARETPAPALALQGDGVPMPDDATHPVQRAGNIVVAPDGSTFGSIYKDGVYAHGVANLAIWAAAQTAPLAHSASVLRVLVTVAQNEGQLEALNSYDDAFLSVGFQQWTLGEAATAGELPAVLKRLQAADAQAYEECFGRYGLGTSVSGGTGYLTLNGDVVDMPAKKEVFRSITWAYRFWRACHHPSLRKAQVTVGAARIGVACGLPLNTQPGTTGTWLTSEQGAALLLDEHVNRPSHVRDTLEHAIADVLAQGVENDPSLWGDKEEAQLIHAYTARRDASNMTDPAGRAQRILQSVLAGKLSDKRGSFMP